MSAFQLYLILKMDSFINFFGVFIFIISFFIIGCLITYVNSDNSKKDIPLKFILFHFKWAIPSLILCIMLNIFIPSTKDMAIIYVTPKVINNEQIQKIPNKLIGLANEWLDEFHPDSILHKDTINGSQNNDAGTILP